MSLPACSAHFLCPRCGGGWRCAWGSRNHTQGLPPPKGVFLFGGDHQGLPGKVKVHLDEHPGIHAFGVFPNRRIYYRCVQRPERLHLHVNEACTRGRPKGGNGQSWDRTLPPQPLARCASRARRAPQARIIVVCPAGTLFPGTAVPFSCSPALETSLNY